MNAGKSGNEFANRLMNSQNSGNDRTKVLETNERATVWTWTQESLLNARKYGHERRKVCWTHESMGMNARRSELKRTKVWTWTQESPDIKFFFLGRSWHSHFPSGTVWTYLLPSGTSACELNLYTFFSFSQFNFQWVSTEVILMSDVKH